jgi:hypothetical protein
VPSAGTKKAGFKKFGSWTPPFLPFESPASTYQVIATPLAPNRTGVRYFCSFADAVVRVRPTSSFDLLKRALFHNALTCSEKSDNTTGVLKN